MKRSLLLDADVVIDLHRLELYEQISGPYDIKVTREVFGEVKYFRRGNTKVPIDISQKVTIIEEVDVDCLRIVWEEAGKAKLSVNPGEATLIAYLLRGEEDILLCLLDGAAIKLIAYMNLEVKSISLEKAFQDVGHRPRLYQKHSESKFRDFIKQGKELRIYDMEL